MVLLSQRFSVLPLEALFADVLIAGGTGTTGGNLAPESPSLGSGSDS